MGWVSSPVPINHSNLDTLSDIFRIGGESFRAEEIVRFLAPIASPNRLAKIREVISRRTYTVTVVLDQLYDRGNISAVMRSAEAHGIQSVHIVETGEKFKVANRVTQGAEKWLDVQKWDDPLVCAQKLKSHGYRICTTRPDAEQELGDIDFTKPIALVFGNEKDGVSETFERVADIHCAIPMNGFTESFNISVAAALSLYHAFEDRNRRQNSSGDLNEQQQLILQAKFLLKSVAGSEIIIRGLKKKEERPLSEAFLHTTPWS